MCRYSGKSADENLCDYAHGEKELQEWKQRHKYRMMKMEKLKEERLFSFLDNLLQEYNFTNQKETVVSHWINVYVHVGEGVIVTEGLLLVERLDAH